jgi:uncharacterized membrane protein
MPPVRTPSSSVIATGVIVLAMLAAGLAAMTRLPPDALVATHFDGAGTADGWMPARYAFLPLPAVGAGMWILQVLLPRLDPRGENLRRSARAYATIWIAAIGVMAALQGMVIALALGLSIDVSRVVLIALGALLAVTGNVFGKLRWNYTVGIRTPWTLASERVWDRTHRFGGRCFVAGGLGLAIAGLLNVPSAWMMPLVVGTTLATVIASVLRSWMLWRDEQSRGAA